MPTVKTAISIDKSLFERVDALAHQMGIARSQLFAEAVEHFMEQRQSRELLERFNDVYSVPPTSAERERLSGMKRLHRKVVEGEW